MEAGAHSDRLHGLDPDQRRRLRAVLETRKKNGSQLVAEGLVRIGVSRLYTVCGSPIDGILKAAMEAGLEVMGTRAQFAPGVISGIENFIRGKLVSAVCVSSGPAVTNTVTGVHVAQANNRPLVVLGSRRGFPGETAAFQDAGMVELMAPVTKWAAEVSSVDEVIPMIHEAFRVAMAGVPGPVYLELPESVLSEKGLQASASTEKETGVQEIHPDAVCLDQAVMLLKAAERPLLCLGEDLRWDWDPAAIRNLVDRHRLPFITTPMGRGLLPDNHPCCLNQWRRQVQQRADLFLMIGGGLDWRFRFGRDLPADCRNLHVTDNPDQLGINRATDWQALMAPMEFVRLLAAQVSPPCDSFSGWTNLLTVLRENAGQRFDPAYLSPKGFVDPAAFMLGLRSRLPDDAIVVIDGSICLSLANHILEAKHPFSWFDPGLNGCIGVGIPQAMGAKLAEPDRPVVAIIGDTGFGISGLEMETVARYGLGINVIVFNNSGITGAHRDRVIIGEPNGKTVGSFQNGLRYDEVARGLGVKSSCSDDLGTSLDQLDAMLASDGPGCLNLIVDPDYPIPDIW